MTEDQLREAGSVAAKIRALTFQLEDLRETESADTAPKVVAESIVRVLQWQDRDLDGRRQVRLVSPNTLNEIRAMLKSDLAQQLDRAKAQFAAL
jgi:hypothetical protein